MEAPSAYLDACSGAVFSGGLVVHASATVLATGGYAGLFGRTTNSRISNGKGILEAARGGARVADLEFIQFHPTVFDGAHPFLITEALRGAGAFLVDEHGVIVNGGQNLPGNWEGESFNLAHELAQRLPRLEGHEPVVVMHNDAVVQGLSEVPNMKDVHHWGVLTIGTGLGNARFTNREDE